MTTRPPTDPQDLLHLLAVARRGRYAAAARDLGVRHTTVSRRVAALEKALGARLLVETPAGWEPTDRGREALIAAEAVEAALRGLDAGPRPDIDGIVRVAGPNGFGHAVTIPAAVDLHERHPGLQLEVINAVQRLRQARSGIDIEVVIGRPDIRRAGVTHLCDYTLRLYATPRYLARHGRPERLTDLTRHTLVYYVPSDLQVDALDAAVDRLPTPARRLSTTSVLGHIAATERSAGIGVLPAYLAATRPGLVEVLTPWRHRASYWAVVRGDSTRRPAVGAVLIELRRRARDLDETAPTDP